MKSTQIISQEKTLIRACHVCAKISESPKEIERCLHCNKAFLPLRYFEKIHHDKDRKWDNHFLSADQVDESDLIKGLFVLW